MPEDRDSVQEAEGDYGTRLRAQPERRRALAPLDDAPAEEPPAAEQVLENTSRAGLAVQVERETEMHSVAKVTDEADARSGEAA